VRPRCLVFTDALFRAVGTQDTEDRLAVAIRGDVGPPATLGVRGGRLTVVTGHDAREPKHGTNPAACGRRPRESAV